ncbi:MAG: YceH family protein [Actinomycetota bacterium]
MLPALDPVGARVLGCLIEKERLTPQAYPLTLNALVTACNQATGREPVMELDESQVMDALGELRSESLTRTVHPRSGRGVTKYRHVVDEVFSLEGGPMAVLCLLLLRGEQTAAELRSRSERMHDFEDQGEVDDVLAELSERGFATELPRRPGQSATRWTTTWGRGPVGVSSQESPVAVVPPVAVPTGAVDDEDIWSEVDELRREVAMLRASLDEVRRELGLS